MDNILKYFPKLDHTQEEQLKKLLVLLPQWNEKVNVISRKDIENLEVHHVLHSMSIALFVSFAQGAKVLDIGTGGGFPGIPLAILFPSVKFTLIDSVRKKTKVTRDIAVELGLKNVKVFWSRAEELNDSFDFVVARAVTRLDTFWSWTKPLLRKGKGSGLGNGLLYLKGGNISEELAHTKVDYQYWPLANKLSEEFFSQKGLVYIRY